MTMLERVARAIYDSCPMFMAAGLSLDTLKQIPWEDLQSEDRQEAIDAARAAIEALMEPTSEMLNAGASKQDEFDRRFESDNAYEIFEAMLKAVLEEK